MFLHSVGFHLHKKREKTFEAICYKVSNEKDVYLWTSRILEWNLKSSSGIRSQGSQSGFQTLKSDVPVGKCKK